MGRTRWLLGAVSLALLLTGCADRHTAPSNEERARYAETMPPLNEPVRFYLMTHCGLDFARIGGQWWRAIEPISDEASGGSPHGWDNPYQEGRLTVRSTEQAVFTADGTDVVFTPSTDGSEPPPCR